ncbi:MAG: hypothetical protein KAS32_29955 [Candidatus Peribacteraceae bacterium]|nr:hypothetical protein [Candidatus Peribacteraceae bacterium]
MKKINEIMMIVCMILLSVLVLPTNVSADETLISIDYPVVDGVDASFSFFMSYNPASTTILSGESVNLNFAPESNTVEVTLNIEDLLVANGIIVPIEFAPYLQDEITLPITRTPIGTETIYSYVIPIATGLAIVVDANIIGEIEATLSNEGGTLSDSHLNWNNWGGKETTLDTLDDEHITVFTNFTYEASLSFTLDFIIGGVSWYNYPIPSVELGQIQFPQTIIQTINTVKPYSVGYSDGYAEGFYYGNISGYEEGIISVSPDYNDEYYLGYEDGYYDAFDEYYDMGYDDGFDEGSGEIDTEDEGLPSLGVFSIIATVLVLAVFTRKRKVNNP